MTVDPRLQLTPGEYLIHPDGSASKVVDKRNMTVDEILATGQYTDRSGREWDYIEGTDAWCTAAIDHEGTQWGARWMEPDEMRLLIERDQHRSVCGGAWRCIYHPVPMVYKSNCGWEVVIPWSNGLLTDEAMGSVQEAFAAARALAVGE